MKDIVHRLNAYIQKHPFDSGDSDCKTVLDQLYQAYAESHESDPAVGQGFESLLACQNNPPCWRTRRFKCNADERCRRGLDRAAP